MYIQMNNKNGGQGYVWLNSTSLTRYPNECEILIEDGQKFKVLGVEKDPDDEMLTIISLKQAWLSSDLPWIMRKQAINQSQQAEYPNLLF